MHSLFVVKKPPRKEEVFSMLNSDPFSEELREIDVKVAKDLREEANTARRSRFALIANLLREMGCKEVRPGSKLNSLIKARLTQGYSEPDLHYVAKKAHALSSDNEIYLSPFYVFSEAGVADILSRKTKKNSLLSGLSQSEAALYNF